MTRRRIVWLVLCSILLAYGAYVLYYFSDFRLRRESRLLWSLPAASDAAGHLRLQADGSFLYSNDQGLHSFDQQRTLAWSRRPQGQGNEPLHLETYELGPDGRLYCAELDTALMFPTVPSIPPIGPAPQTVDPTVSPPTGFPLMLRCLDPGGEMLWSLDSKFSNQYPGQGTLVLTAPGYVLLAVTTGNVLVCDTQGQELVRFILPLATQQLPQQDNNQQLRIDELGQIYFNQIGVGVTAFDTKGKQRWLYPDPGASYGELTQAPGGTIYYANGKETVALSRKDGKVLWRCPVAGGVWNPAPSFYFAPGVGLYVLGASDDLNLIGLDGKLKFTRHIALTSHPASGFSLGNLFYPGLYSNYNYGYGYGYDNLYGGAVGPGGVLYLATQSQGLQAFSPKGRRLWHALLLEPLVSSPQCSPDGALYLRGSTQLMRVRP